LYGFAAAAVFLNVGLGAAGLEGVITATPDDLWGVVLQLVAVLGVLALADLTVFRRRARRPVPVWWVFALGGVDGLARVGVGALQSAGGGDESYSLGEALIIGGAVVVTTSLAPPIIAYLRATREWYLHERESILAREAEAEAQRMRATGALEAVRGVALATAISDVEAARSDARRVLEEPGADPSDVAGALLSAARAGVRPASHALVRHGSASRRPRVSAWAVARDAMARHPLPIAIPLVLVVGFTAPRVALTNGGLAALLYAGFIAFGVTASFGALRGVIRRLPALAPAVTLGACLLAMLPMAILVTAFAPLIAVSGVPLGGLVPALALFTFVTINSMVVTAEDAAQAVLEEMQAPVRRAEVEARAAERSRDDLLRDIGLHLHTAVQSGLVAASYAIQDAVERGDPDALEHAIAGARDALDRTMDSSVTQLESGAAITQVTGEWDGIIDVAWSPNPPPAGADDRRVVEVIRECLANAVVHGHASHVTVRLRVDGPDVIVEIEDDGVGPQAGAPGLGSSVLADASGGRWAIAPGPGGGAIVRATVARPG
jgi:hypothetical protein